MLPIEYKCQFVKVCEDSLHIRQVLYPYADFMM